MTDLLAQAGETVHVIAHRWDQAPAVREESRGGRLIVHRVALDEPVPDRWTLTDSSSREQVPRGLLASYFPAQAFSWQASLLAEQLIDREGIDVIEAQEWEAPLYYLQLRRALNLGPAGRPPCVVHIHSPSERIFAANGWDVTVADYAPAVSLEEYSITAADALLCPSRFVAEQTLARYRIDPSRLHVIPYPLGDVARLHRSADTWSAGSICHVGRLEPRKGVLELADAVAAIACDFPDLAIEFVGGDTPLRATGGSTVGEAVRARVPRRVRRQLRFLGSRDRAGVFDALSRARAAVVPSRWENFPYSCIESMASGLPVIGTPNGGVPELVADGVSGWIAGDTTPASLAVALRRALDTPPAQRERMGEAASATVRRICCNELIVRQHLETKGQIVQPTRSRTTPTSPPVRALSLESPAASATQQPSAHAGLRRGIGVVVACEANAPGLADCLSGLRAQLEPPAAVCIVCDALPSIPAGGSEGWRVVGREGAAPGEAEISAAALMSASDQSLMGVAFVDARVRLSPGFLATCGTVFAHDDGLGIVSAWTHELVPQNRVHVQPHPAVPYIWCGDETTPYVAVRAEAFQEAVRPQVGDAPQGRSPRRVFDRVMRTGWTAVTYPAVLGSIVLEPTGQASRPSVVRYSSMARAVQRLHMPLLEWLRACPPEERRTFVQQGIRNPARSARWLADRAMRRWRASASAANSPTAPSRDHSATDLLEP